MEKLEQTIVKHGTTPSFTGSGNSTGAGNSITFEAPLLGDQLEPYVINSLCSIFVYTCTS